MNKIKIFHIADMQYEIRVSGEGGQRYEEYLSVTNSTINEVERQRPDVVVIAGDIFEYETTTGDEQKMFGYLLNKLTSFDFVKRVIVVDGNHDVKQKVNGIIVDGKKTNTITSIESVVSIANNPKISYYKHTGIYRDSYYQTLSWAVWSQLDKWSAKIPKPNYSPWVDNPTIETKNLIEIYHDPIQNCLGFDGKVSNVHSKYGITLNDFRANVIIAGDIHAPAIMWFNDDKLFTYSSSLIARNFGEGDYFYNGAVAHFGNNKHGYNIIEYNLDTDKAESCEFISIKNPVHRFTIILDAMFVYDEQQITNLAKSLSTSSINYVRLVAKENVTEFIKAQELLSKIFNEIVPNVRIDFDYEADVLAFDVDENVFTDLTTVIDKDKILEISKKYINQIVTKTTTIEKEDVEKTEEYIYSLLEKALDKTDLSNKTKTISLGEFDVDNFMKLGKTKFLFQDNKITVISGSNRVGKTTLKHLINFTFTDQISASQNMRNKKFNYLQYFNTGLPDSDVVDIKHTFFINGEKHELYKKLTRIWKAKKRDPFDKNWIDNIKDVEVELIIKTPTDELSGSLAFEFLNNLFTFDDLQNLAFVNSGIIENFVTKSVEDIASDFLTIMGLDISTALENGFDDLKNEEINKISKPSKTIDEIVKLIEAEVIKKTTNEQNIVDTQKTIEKLNTEKLRKELDIQAIENTKHPVDMVQNIQNKLVSLQNDINVLENNKVSLNNEIQLIRGEKNSLNTMLEDKQNLMSNLNNLLDEKNKKNNSLLELNTKKAELTNSAKEVIMEIQNSENEKVNVLVQEKSTINEEQVRISNLINTKNNEINALISVEEQKIDLKISELNNGYNALSNDILTKTNELNQKIVDNNNITNTRNNIVNELQKLKVSLDSVCSTCGERPSDESKQRISLTIKNKENELILNVVDENGYNTINSEISELNTKKDNILNEIAKLRGEKSNVYLTISNLLEPLKNEVEALRITLGESNTKVISIDEKINQIKNNINEIIKSNQRVIDLQNEVINTNVLIGNINEEINTIDFNVNGFNEKLFQLNTKIDSINEIETRVLELTQKIDTIDKDINTIKIHIDVNNNNLVLANKNIEIENSLIIPKNELSQINNQISASNSQLSQLEYEKTTLGNVDTQLQKELDDAKKYKLIEASFKLYKKLIGKNGLPQYVFAHLVPLINNQLNSILSDVDFRLLFDKDTLELRFNDIKEMVTRPISFCSGMERTVIGLTITNIKRILNHAVRLNFIMIDEISGTLNSGEDLEYEAKNYQQIVMNFIERVSENVPIYIVDHVLNFKNARIVTVKPTEQGSIFC